MREEQNQVRATTPSPTGSIADFPPEAGHAHPGDQVPDIRTADPPATEVFLNWEIMRLIFNFILVLLLMVLHGAFWKTRFTLYELFLIAATVNACYCAGPVAEGYLTWFGMPRNAARWSAFLIGTAIIVLFVAELISIPAPVRAGVDD